MQEDSGPERVSRNLRSTRRARGLTQADLAERSRLSISTIRKIEQGGSARIETLHDLARALDVKTSDLFNERVLEPVASDDINRLSLLRLRRALTPGISIVDSGRLGLTQDIQRIPNMTRLGESLREAVRLYRADDYVMLVRFLPEMIQSANEAVEFFSGDGTRREAVRIRANVFQLTGWFLTQVRQYDLAYSAIRDAIRDGLEADDQLTATAGVISQCWLFIRQGRFDEAEQLAAFTATRAEPRVISTATVPQLSAWGWLLLRGSAAAIRNNRPQEAAEFLTLAEVASVRVRENQDNYHQYWTTFTPQTVRMKTAETAMILGDSRRVLRIHEDIRDIDRKSDNLNRHLLDVANAHVSLRDFQDGLDVLTRIRRSSPEWLRNQQKGRDALSKILKSRKRTLTREMRDMAEFLGVTA
jgi:transcriptional regulator with XRE-family HTH domain